jgi:hypothetical protein
MLERTPTKKICCVCGEDCSRRPRTRDPKGRYACTTCYTRAQSEPPLVADLVDEAARPRHCPGCGQTLMPGAVICVECGFDARIGACREPIVARAAPPPGTERTPSKWDLIVERARADSRRRSRMDVLYPLVLVGAGLVMIAMAGGAGTGAAFAPAGLTIAYFAGLVLSVALGVAALWVASHLWLGGAGPLPLAVLRLAAVYAVVDGVAVIAAPLLIIGWLLALAVYIGLMMWLFELDARDAVMLTALTFLIKLGASLVLVPILL